MHGIETELGRPVYGMAEYLFRSLPVVGTLWSRGGGIPAHPDNAYRLLHDEQQLALVFPEGSKATGQDVLAALPAATLRTRRLRRDRDARRRARHPARGRRRRGVDADPVQEHAAREAAQHPLLPDHREHAAVRSGRPRPYFPAKFKIRVLPPVHFDVPANQERYSRSRVMEESERIRRMVQEALYDMLRKRRSVWFG